MRVCSVCVSPEHGLADGDVVGEGDGVDGVAEVELRRLHGRGVLAPLEGAACTPNAWVAMRKIFLSQHKKKQD